ncbi:MAG: citrate synthase [Bdellovibrionales bacterium]|nr:citrate synthase [Bdellovibrionales bacterium]
MELTKQDLYRPGMEGIPACYSSIGFIDGKQGILQYRGFSIEELCQNSTFEEVAYILIYGELPSSDQLADFSAELVKAREIPEPLTRIITQLPKEGHPMTVLQSMTAALALYSEGTSFSDSKEQAQAMIDIIAKVPSMIALFDRYRKGLDEVKPDSNLGHAENFLYMLSGDRPSPTATRIMDVCFILHAEHTLNASTFSARVTTSTQNDPFTAISAAVGTLYGPLHGGANEKVLHMLESIGSKEKVRGFVENKIESKEKIMGIGHRVYKTKDPRASILQNLAEKLFDEVDSSQLLDTAHELEKIALEKFSAKGLYPNVDFYSGIVYNALGISTDIFTPIFAAARTAGWVAHWKEQTDNNRLYRPTQIYEGSPARSYVSIDKR